MHKDTPPHTHTQTTHNCNKFLVKSSDHMIIVWTCPNFVYRLGRIPQTRWANPKSPAMTIWARTSCWHFPSPACTRLTWTRTSRMRTGGYGTPAPESRSWSSRMTRRCRGSSSSSTPPRDSIRRPPWWQRRHHPLCSEKLERWVCGLCILAELGEDYAVTLESLGMARYMQYTGTCIYLQLSYITCHKIFL